MIRELRDQLAADLGVIGVPVHTSWPDRITPPVIFLTPPTAGSYVTGGQTFGSFVCSVDVVILAARSDTATTLDGLEDLVEGVLTNTADWSLSGVDAPGLVTISGLEYLGTTAHLSKTARLP